MAIAHVPDFFVHWSPNASIIDCLVHQLKMEFSRLETMESRDSLELAE